jgi:hypothetical protein
VDVLAEVPAFYSTEVARCADLGMDVTGVPVSHVDVRNSSTSASSSATTWTTSPGATGTC